MLSTIFTFVSVQQALIILVILLVLFGGRKIPELMRGLGTGIKEFKEATKEDEKKEDKKEEITK